MAVAARQRMRGWCSRIFSCIHAKMDENLREKGMVGPVVPFSRIFWFIFVWMSANQREKSQPRRPWRAAAARGERLPPRSTRSFAVPLARCACESGHKIFFSTFHSFPVAPWARASPNPCVPRVPRKVRHVKPAKFDKWRIFFDRVSYRGVTQTGNSRPNTDASSALLARLLGYLWT